MSKRLMQIIGVGTDIVETDRIAEICERLPQFEVRVFTQSELDDCSRSANRSQRLAARFAAKEAVAKSFGRSFSWQEVEIFSEPSGRPAVRLHGRARAAAGERRVMLSMSHSRHHATAVALLVSD